MTEPKPPTEQLLRRAAEEVRRLRQAYEKLEQRQRAPIAVVGMSGRFPGGADLEAFWQLLAQGKEAVVDVMPRWQGMGLEALVNPSISPRWAALLDQVDQFDASFFGISSREADRLDPQQRLLLELAWEALEGAGIPTDSLAGSPTGVYVGVLFHDYELRLLGAQHLADFHSTTGAYNTFAAGRLSYTLGLQGPCLTLDTACSSSLVAIHLACQSLRAGESKLALACGVNLILAPEIMDMLQHTQALSPDGRCKTFDARANGYVRGEGGGVLVLKRLSDAQRDGDPVLAVIRGTAVNQDGASTALTSPSATAQAQLLRQALADAQLDVNAIDCIEAHGTGTAIGDPIEMEALRAVYAPGRTRPLYIGAVKTNVGHLESAAGMSGIFKAILALQKQQWPPHRNLETLNPMITLDDTPFVIPTTLQPWPRGEQPRRVGVSAFAMSGTNGHVIVEEAPAVAQAETNELAGPWLLPLSARHPDALRSLAGLTADWLERTPEAQTHDVVYTATFRRAHHSLRLAAVGNSRDEWVTALRAYSAGKPHPLIFTQAQPASDRRAPVFVFPGQGSQWLGMGRGLLRDAPVFAETLRACDAAVQTYGQFSVLAEMQASSPRLHAVEVVQPWLFCLQVSLAALWRSLGVEPAAVVGHSMGEVAAAVVSGALTLQDGARVICLRSRLMQRIAGQGALLAINMTPREAEALVAPWGGVLGVAVVNGPQAVAIAGPTAAVEALQQQLSAQNQFSARVKTDVAFHSPHMDALMEPLRAGLVDLQPGKANVPLYSTVTGARQTAPVDGDYWVRNLRQPVQFSNAVQALLREGLDTFLEISPHPVLSHALQTFPAVASVASTRRDQPELSTVLGQLGLLYSLGHRINWPRRSGRVVALPNTPFVRQRHWLPAAPQTSLGGPRTAQAHPLLGAPVTLANGTMAWESEISLERHPWLADHRVGEAVVVPAAVYAEMLLAAGRMVFNTSALEVQDLKLQEVLILRPEVPTLMQVVREKTGSMMVCSHTPQGWTTHATGRVAALQGVATDTAEVDAPPAVPPLEAAAIYPRLATLDLHYGPAFQGITKAWLHPSGAQARLRAVPTSAFVLSPMQLDAALQVAGLEVADAGPNAPWLPVGVERLQVLADPTLGLTCTVLCNQRTPTFWSGRVTLLDAQNRPVVRVEGLHLQQLAPVASRGDVLITTTWEKLPASASVNTPASGADPWLVVGDSKGFGLAVQQALTAANAKTQYVPADADVVAAVARAQSVRGIVYLTGLDAPGPADWARTQALTCDVPIKLVNALTNKRWRDMPRLWLVSRGAHAVDDDTAQVDPAQALVWGLGRSVGYEVPLLRCSRVDLRLTDALTQRESTAHALVREMLTGGNEDELALRAERRYAARLGRAPIPAAAVPRLRPDGTYLVTGGLGGLGLALADWLTEHGAGHVLLCSRRTSVDAQQQARIDAMTGRGARVHRLPLDIADAQALAAVLARTGAEWPPLRGVVHTAGVLDDALLAEQTPERVARVLTPKVVGAWNLHSLTADMPLDFFVLYASAAGLLGSPAQASYAAANSALDALAVLRRQQGKCAVAIDWGPFAEVGMAAAADNRGNRLTQRGMRSLTVPEGHALVAALMHGPHAHVGAMHLSSRQWLESFPQLAGGSLFRHLAKEGRRPVPTDANLRAKLQAAPAEERTAMLRGYLFAEIASVLRVDLERVVADAPLKGLGIDSLLGLELRNRLEAALGVRLAATLVWVHPTPGALLKHLVKELDFGAAAGDAPAPAAPTEVLANVADKSDAELEAALEAELTLGEQTGAGRG